MIEDNAPLGSVDQQQTVSGSATFVTVVEIADLRNRDSANRLHGPFYPANPCPGTNVTAHNSGSRFSLSLSWVALTAAPLGRRPCERGLPAFCASRTAVNITGIFVAITYNLGDQKKAT